MRRGSLVTVLFLALLACKKGHNDTSVESAAASAQVVPIAADAIAFGSYTPKVGDRRTERINTDTRFDVTITAAGASQVLKVSQRDSRTVKIEVLEVSGGKESKLRVTYDAIESTETKGEASVKTRGKDLLGRTFIVEARSGKPEVSLPDGTKAPKVLGEMVAEHFEDLGKPETITQALPKRPLKAGETLEGLGDAIVARFAQGAKKAPHFTGGRATLEKIEGAGADRVGIVAFELGADIDQDGIVIKLAMKGTLRVRASDGRMSNMSIDAPLKLEAAKGKPFTATGTGKTTFNGSASFD
jgi:hypothetical protein